MHKNQNYEIAGAHITEWIKTLLAIGAIIIAINEFFLKDRAKEIARINNTKEFLMKGAEPEVLNSLTDTISNIRGGKATEKWTALAEAEPANQYLIAWAVCLDTGICDAEIGNKHLCQRIIGFEGLIEELYQVIGVTYNKSKRDADYQGFLSKCKI